MRRENPVPRYVAMFKASGKTPHEFACWAKARHKSLCLEVMEMIGSWPSSEPELAALQRLWP